MVLCISRPHVGDFVDYALISPTDEQLQKLNEDIAQYSGAEDNSEKVRAGSTLSCRILEVDKKGNPTKLISADGINSLRLYDADGYNNAVFLINELCSTLYSGNMGTTRSLKMEDLEDNYFSETATEVIKNLSITSSIYGKTKKVSGSKYPNILSEEKGMGVGTIIINGKNKIRNEGLGQSNQDKPYLGTGDISSLPNSNKGITVTYTNYQINNNSNNFKSITLRSVLSKKPYWIASRSITFQSYALFYVKYYNWTSNAGFGQRNLFQSSDISNSFDCGVSPIIILNDGVKAKYIQKYNSLFNKWKLE